MSEPTASYQVTLPSGAVAEVRGWTMALANRFVNGRAGSEIKLETKLLDETATVVDPGVYGPEFSWSKALVCDRLVALIAGRIMVWGPELPIRFTCPVRGCGARLQMVDADVPIEIGGDPCVNLQDLIEREVYDLSPESRETFAAGNVFRIDFHGHAVEFRLPTAESAERTMALVRQAKGDAAARTLVGRLISIDGVTGVPEMLRVLNEGPFYWAGLIPVLDQYDGGVDTDVEMACGSCGWEGVMALPLAGSEFMQPTRTTAPARKKRGELANH